MVKTKVNYQGREWDAERVDVNQATEYWNQYLLEDGSVLRLKTIVTEVVKLPDQYDLEGNPVYVTKSGNIVVVSAPESLKKR